MNNFERAIDRILGHEGGYVDNPHDAGGKTNWGVSQRSYPNLDIAALTREQAIALYKRDFWDRLSIERFPAEVGFQILDCAINSGGGTALRMLQRAVGVADDGVAGPATMAAIAAAEPHALVMRFTAERLIFMTNCVGWPNFAKGWARRVATNLKYGADDV